MSACEQQAKPSVEHKPSRDIRNAPGASCSFQNDLLRLRQDSVACRIIALNKSGGHADCLQQLF